LNFVSFANSIYYINLPLNSIEFIMKNGQIIKVKRMEGNEKSSQK